MAGVPLISGEGLYWLIVGPTFLVCYGALLVFAWRIGRDRKDRR